MDSWKAAWRKQINQGQKDMFGGQDVLSIEFSDFMNKAQHDFEMDEFASSAWWWAITAQKPG